jgi:tetratricopeptide (TPR) repeat protein
VVELSPDIAHGYVNLGVFHTRKENWAGAEKSFLRALELDPSRISTITNLAKVYYERGQFHRAIEYYKRALDLNNRSHLRWGNLGMTYHRIGNREESRKALERAVQLIDSELLVNPKNAELHSYLGYYRAMLGLANYGDSLRLALELAPEDLSMTSRIAEAYAIQGEKGRAVDLVRQIVAKGYNVQSLRRSHDLRGLLSAAGIKTNQ